MFTLIKKTLIALSFTSLMFSYHADDIDIIDSQKLIDANVLFVMDLSGSMKWCPGPYTGDDEECDSGPSRLDILQGSFQDIVNDGDFDGINIGLSVFSGGAQGGSGVSVAHGISYPVSPLIGTAADNTLAQNFLNTSGFIHPGTSPDNSYMPAAGTMNTRQYLGLLSSDAIWQSSGSTPIVDALFEAARYFRGENVYFGRFAPNDIRSAHPSTYVGSLSLTSTTITPACTVGTRVSCASGSCGPTESCTTNPSTVTSATDTGGCTVNTGRTLRCADGETSCGVGTGCVESTDQPTRWCGTTNLTIATCMTANPTWHSCETYVHSEYETNSEGQTTFVETTRVRCVEDITYYSCNDVDNYSCPSSYQSCTKCPDEVTNTAVDGSAQYKSPITGECQKNGIILLTDGQPTSNTSADEITTMVSTYAQGCQNAPSPGTETQVYGRCGPELARFLATEDQADGSTSVANIDGTQTVKTYTVGLSIDEGSETADYLGEIAQKGGGAFVTANDRAGLTKAFKDAVIGIADKQARSFASPSYSIDTTTLLSHGDTVYVPVFDRAGTVWPGNLKKYKIVDGVLTDADDSPALDASGSLLATARDMWSSDPSTDVILSGGAANKIDPATRNIKTDNGSSLVTLNTSIANSTFGLGSSTADDNLKADLVKFIKGSNADGTPRNHMGDIIHSKPVQLIKAGATAADADEKFIFVGTNEGYLHAINDADGTEEFAYMPQELLNNINTQYSNAATPNHVYGVDGPTTLWLDERGSSIQNHGNGILDAGEKAYLFFGLRRGGKHYYALDVTNPSSPVLKWKAQFGTGDSWSQPVVAMLKQGTGSGDPTPVLVIGGGYNEDASGTQTNGGNAVYIVDAIGASTGGDVIWTTPTSSTYAPDGAIATTDAVPSRIRVLDVDRNGSIDRLYFGDTGGNIWRVDLNASNYATVPDYNNINKAKMYKFAQLGGTGADNRKFFEEPDVAVFRQAGKYVATVAIGSGDRTRPLEATVDDRFFVLYDKEVFIKPSASTITMDATTGGLKASSAVTPADLSTAAFRGWHKDLTSSSGEKVLSTAVTFNNKVMFTTFGLTSVVTTTACGSTNSNEARLYIMDLLSANEDANTVAATGEIIGTPSIIFGELKKQGTDITCDIAGGDKNCERKVMVRVGKAGPFVIPNASGSPTTGGQATTDALPRVYWLDNEK